MAGSRKYFVYTTDDGTDFAANLDESNTEAVNGGTQDYADGVTVKYTLPGNISPRAAVYRNAAGTRTIRCVCLTQAIYSGVLAGASTIPDPITSGQTLTLVRLEPERFKLVPIASDSGLNDGDAT